MILHPGILALLISSAISLVMLGHAAVAGTRILLFWDYGSSSARQLALEKRTYLISTYVNTALVLQISSALLFAYTAEDIHPLFVGAMCATGSLNAEPVGWYVIFTKIAVVFLAGIWLAVNAVDKRAESSPLVRVKYAMLLAVIPLFLLDGILQFVYFARLEPNIITSCCGSLFSSDSDNVVGSLATLPVKPMMITFFTYTVILLAVLLLSFRLQCFWKTGITLLLTAGYFPLAILAITSFLSIFIYEIPTHHCPFDILQKEYGFTGYPMYSLLFVGVYFGMLPGLFCPLKNHPALGQVIAGREKSWLLWSLTGLVGFAALAAWSVYSSNLRYYPY